MLQTADTEQPTDWPEQHQTAHPVPRTGQDGEQPAERGAFTYTCMELGDTIGLTVRMSHCRPCPSPPLGLPQSISPLSDHSLPPIPPHSLHLSLTPPSFPPPPLPSPSLPSPLPPSPLSYPSLLPSLLPLPQENARLQARLKKKSEHTKQLELLLGEASKQKGLLLTAQAALKENIANTQP